MLRHTIKAFLTSFKPTSPKVKGCVFSEAASLTSYQACPVLNLTLKFFIVLAAYYIAAKCGLMVPYKESGITLLWLPTGIAAGAIMRWGKVSIFATFIAAYLVESSLGLNIQTSIAIAVGNTLAPLATAYCLLPIAYCLLPIA